MNYTDDELRSLAVRVSDTVREKLRTHIVIGNMHRAMMTYRGLHTEAGRRFAVLMRDGDRGDIQLWLADHPELIGDITMQLTGDVMQMLHAFYIGSRLPLPEFVDVREDVFLRGLELARADIENGRC